MTDKRILRVGLPPEKDRSYDIVIGKNILSGAGALLKERVGTMRFIIVTDETVGPLYAARLEASLKASGHTHLGTVTLPAGEQTKSWARLEKLHEEIALRGADRKAYLITLGGGVIGDITGFAAATFMRGMNFVQIPTTLLSQTDSSVGGKTMVNMSFAKNSVGAFYQPRAVLIDTDTLSTLPRRQILAGYAEVVKYGLIMDEAFFGWCEANGKTLVDGNEAARIMAVEKSCALKAQIVAQDEKEAGRRALLNLGHTFGHALESWTHYDGSLLHGEAVAIGCVMAFKLSAKLGLCSAHDAARIEAHFKDVGLPVRPPKSAYDIDALMGFMALDKKNESGDLTLILARGIGNCFVQKAADLVRVRELWEQEIG